MITRDNIEQLGHFDGRGARVLSVYLDLDPARLVSRTHLIVFEDLLKETRERLDQPVRGELLREAVKVQTWLDGEAPRGQGVAIFSCVPRDFWQAHFFPSRVKDHLAFETTVDVAPLLELQDEYERYAVALVDKTNARLFTVYMGEIEESDILKEEGAHVVPMRTEHAHTNFPRHHDEHVHWHLKRVAGRLAELLGRRRFDRLILAGPEESTAGLRRALPRVLLHRLAATIPLEMAAHDRNILEKTLEVEKRVEREVEDRVVSELFEVAGAGGRATLGLPATLDALWLGEVQTLVVADGAHQAGRECPNCGRLDPGETAACPACGASMAPLHDLLHRAMGRAADMAGTVEVVRGDAAKRLLEAGSGVGALLRYR